MSVFDMSRERSLGGEILVAPVTLFLLLLIMLLHMPSEAEECGVLRLEFKDLVAYQTAQVPEVIFSQVPFG